MSAKWKTHEIRTGATMWTTFFVNPVDSSKYRYRATHLNGKRAPKVVLTDDERVRPGIRTEVRIVAVHKPERSDRGWIEVEFVRAESLKLQGIYLDPLVSRKLQVLLESGLNILLDGPQGSGKTVLARALAETLGMEFVFFNCAAVLEATDFMATIQVRAADNGAPVTDFVATDLRNALLEAEQRPVRRYLIFLDELNRCPEAARNTLMPALDSTRKLFDPVTNSFLQIPDNVQFVAAVNRGRAFTRHLRHRRSTARSVRPVAGRLPARRGRGEAAARPPSGGVEDAPACRRGDRQRGAGIRRARFGAVRTRHRGGVHLSEAPSDGRG